MWEVEVRIGSLGCQEASLTVVFFDYSDDRVIKESPVSVSYT